MVDMEAFAADWIASWNSHDLKRILSHYASSILFFSPRAQQVAGDGRVEGLIALEIYWRAALDQSSDLKFRLVDKFAGYSCLSILYENHHGQRACETFEVGQDKKVVRSLACYSQPPG